MLGLNLARFRKFPDVKEVGLSALPKMVAFCSKHCHYSNQKNAALLGLGTNNMVGIEVNEIGEMDINDLKRKVNIALQEVSFPAVVILIRIRKIHKKLIKISLICVIWM